jgi:uncharacterized protein (TIGR02453 family)
VSKSDEQSRFEGFADEDGKFFRALAKNQNKEWFSAHKAQFEEGWDRPMKSLIREVRSKIDRAYPDCDLGEPKAFRIYRDVRFSKDKSPYKTHVAGYLPIQVGAKAVESPAALYVQVGAETFAAAGQYMMTPESLTKLRKSILDDEKGRELAKTVASLEKRGFKKGAMEIMKKVPRGLDPEHPRAELLRHKGLIVTFPEVPRALLVDRKLVDWLVTHAKLVAPLVRWLTFATC